MGAFFYYISFVHYDDLICLAYGGEPMSDDNGGAPLGDFFGGLL